MNKRNTVILSSVLVLVACWLLIPRIEADSELWDSSIYAAQGWEQQNPDGSEVHLLYVSCGGFCQSYVAPGDRVELSAWVRFDFSPINPSTGFPIWTKVKTWSGSDIDTFLGGSVDLQVSHSQQRDYPVQVELSYVQDLGIDPLTGDHVEATTLLDHSEASIHVIEVDPIVDPPADVPTGEPGVLAI